MPSIEAIATSVPPFVVPQREVRLVAEDLLREMAPDLLPKLSVFDTAGIDRRNLVRPLSWFLEPHGWAERARIFRETGLAMMEEATLGALREAGLPPDAIDGIVLVTTTGLSAPSLEALLLDRIGFPRDVQRVPVWGLGCAGGLAGLAVAADLARAHPDRRYLLLSLELCSLNFDLGDMSVRAFVANTLFADGCAAVLVRGDAIDGPAVARVVAESRHTWPRSAEVMGWDIQDEGFRVVFDKRIPQIVERDLAPIMRAFLKEHAVDAPRFVMHPGGTKVLDAYATALGEAPDAFALSREVLREHGNMSSPTVFFVLQRELRRGGKIGEALVAAALGPGFSADLALLERR